MSEDVSFPYQIWEWDSVGCTENYTAYCKPRVLLEGVQVLLRVWHLPQLVSRQPEKEAKKRNFKGREKYVQN